MQYAKYNEINVGRFLAEKGMQHWFGDTSQETKLFLNDNVLYCFSQQKMKKYKKKGVNILPAIFVFF